MKIYHRVGDLKMVILTRILVIYDEGFCNGNHVNS